MKTIRFAMFLLYRYYRRGRWESDPYFHALCTMSFLAFLHVSAVLFWINQGDMLFGESKITFMIKFLLLLIISLFVFSKLASEKQLQAIKYKEQEIKRGCRLLILYFIMIFALFVTGIIMNHD